MVSSGGRSLYRPRCRLSLSRASAFPCSFRSTACTSFFPPRGLVVVVFRSFTELIARRAVGDIRLRRVSDSKSITSPTSEKASTAHSRSTRSASTPIFRSASARIRFSLVRM